MLLVGFASLQAQLFYFYLPLWTQDCLVDLGEEKAPDSFQAAAQLVEGHIDPNNAFKTVVDSGAKGSIVNIVQISTCVGQQVIFSLTENKMGSLLCCYSQNQVADEFSKRELMHDNILLSFKVAQLKRQKICSMCLKTLDEHYTRTRSTSRAQK